MVDSGLQSSAGFSNMDVLMDFQDIIVYLNVSQTTKQTGLNLFENAILCSSVPSRTAELEEIKMVKKLCYRRKCLNYWEDQMVGTILQGHHFTIKGLNACERMSGPVSCEFCYTFQSMEDQGKNCHHEFWLISYRLFLESNSNSI